MNLATALASFAGKYSPGFIRAMGFLLPSEVVFVRGGYGDYSRVTWEDVPGDDGGVTKWGVDQRSHPGVDIKHLSLEQALAIYHAGEWAAVRGDDLPADVALAVFDSAVNVGTDRAVRWLQLAVGATPDGKLGPRTLAAVRQAGAETAVDGLLASREHYYRQEVGPAKRARFLPGWLARLDNLRTVLRLTDEIPATATV